MPVVDWSNLISGGVGSVLGALASWGGQELNTWRQDRRKRRYTLAAAMAAEAARITEQQDALYSWGRELRDLARLASIEILEDVSYADRKAYNSLDQRINTSQDGATAGSLSSVESKADALVNACRAFLSQCRHVIQWRDSHRNLVPEMLSGLDNVENAYRQLKEELLETGWQIPGLWPKPVS